MLPFAVSWQVVVARDLSTLVAMDQFPTVSITKGLIIKGNHKVID